MSFVDDFLKRQADPTELGAVVQHQGAQIEQTGRSFVRVQSLDEIASEIGQLRYIARDVSGQIRMIMSAINLLDEYGISAHLAGFDTNGVPQFWLSADDGSAVFGRGSITANEDGMFVAEGGDAITFRDNLKYAVLSMRNGSLDLISFEVTTETNQISNGDFETGSLSSWTETDPGGKISVEATDRGYSAKFAAGATSAEHITQNLAASAAYGVVVTLRCKVSAGATAASITVGNSALSLSETASMGTLSGEALDWRNLTFVLYASISDLKVRVISSTRDVYIDDILVRPVPLFGVGRNFSISPAQTRVVNGNFVTPYLTVTPDEQNFYKQGVIMGGPWFLSRFDNVPIDVSGTLTDYYYSDGLYHALRLNTTAATTLQSMHYYSHNNTSFSIDGSLYGGRVVVIMNVGAYDLTVKHNYTTGTNTDSRFDLGGSDLIIPPDGTVVFIYDGYAQVWRVLAVNQLVGAVITSRQALLMHGNNGTVPASSTSYIVPALQGFVTLNAITIPFACTVKNLTVRSNSTQPANNKMVVTVQKEVVDTAITLDITAGAGAQTWTDATHTVSFAAGDRVGIKFQNLANATSASITSVSLELAVATV